MKSIEVNRTFTNKKYGYITKLVKYTTMSCHLQDPKMFTNKKKIIGLNLLPQSQVS